MLSDVYSTRVPVPVANAMTLYTGNGKAAHQLVCRGCWQTSEQHVKALRNLQRRLTSGCTNQHSFSNNGIAAAVVVPLHTNQCKAANQAGEQHPCRNLSGCGGHKAGTDKLHAPGRKLAAGIARSGRLAAGRSQASSQQLLVGTVLGLR